MSHTRAYSFVTWHAGRVEKNRTRPSIVWACGVAPSFPQPRLIPSFSVAMALAGSDLKGRTPVLADCSTSQKQIGKIAVEPLHPDGADLPRMDRAERESEARRCVLKGTSNTQRVGLCVLRAAEIEWLRTAHAMQKENPGPADHRQLLPKAALPSGQRADMQGVDGWTPASGTFRCPLLFAFPSLLPSVPIRALASRSHMVPTFHMRPQHALLQASKFDAQLTLNGLGVSLRAIRAARGFALLQLVVELRNWARGHPLFLA